MTRIAADCESMRTLLTDTTEIDRQIKEKTQESELLADMVRELIYRKASSKQSEKKQKEQEDALCARFDVVAKELQTLKEGTGNAPAKGQSPVAAHPRLEEKQTSPD